MTAIQALERKYPDKPVAANQVARMEFEYIRHGTLSLIAFMEIATGEILCPYFHFSTFFSIEFLTHKLYYKNTKNLYNSEL